MILFASVNVLAQTEINKSLKVNESQSIEIQFDYPELISISTWDRAEMQITGTVLINQGENDDAFELDISENAQTIKIENRIKNLKNLPKRITVMEGEQKIMFPSKEAFEEYKKVNGQPHGGVSYGVDLDILVQIKVPRGTKTSVTSTYGMVEVTNFDGPIVVVAKYGGVDATLSEALIGKLSAETNYGEIYSNLDAKLSSSFVAEKDFHTSLNVNLGKGPAYSFISNYGNVYLRKK